VLCEYANPHVSYDEACLGPLVRKKVGALVVQSLFYIPVGLGRVGIEEVMCRPKPMMVVGFARAFVGD
jgi:hypothetical protein